MPTSVLGFINLGAKARAKASKTRKLPVEILDIILEKVDGDSLTYRHICLTSRHFYDWAKSSAPKYWPRLRQQLREAGRHECEGCGRVLPVKQWVELGPRYWTYEVSCINCRIRELRTSGAYFDEIQRYQQFRPDYRPCLCCMHDYGEARSAPVRQKLADKGAFCERCTVRMSQELGSFPTRELARQCNAQYLEKVKGERTVSLPRWGTHT